MLDAETSLAHFLLHLNVDRFARLNRVTDVMRLVGRANLDWSVTDWLVSADGLQVPVYLSLGAVLDPFDIRDLGETQRGFRAWMWNVLWPERSRLLGENSAHSRLRKRLIPFLARGLLAEALASLAKSVFLPQELLAYVYPDSHGPYLWRVFASRVGSLDRH